MSRKFTGPITTFQRNNAAWGETSKDFFIAGENDPQLVPTFALRGTVYARIGANGGAFYQKQDDGETTNWILNAVVGGVITVDGFPNINTLNFSSSFVVTNPGAGIADVAFIQGENTIPYYPDGGGTDQDVAVSDEDNIQLRFLEKIFGLSNGSNPFISSGLTGAYVGIIGVGTNNQIDANTFDVILNGDDNNISGLDVGVVIGNSNEVYGRKMIAIGDSIIANNVTNQNSVIMSDTGMSVPCPVAGTVLLGESITFNPAMNIIGGSSILGNMTQFNGLNIGLSAIKAIQSVFNGDINLSSIYSLGCAISGTIFLSDVYTQNGGGGGLQSQNIIASIIKSGDATMQNTTASIVFTQAGQFLGDISGSIILSQTASYAGQIIQSMVAGENNTIAGLNQCQLLGNNLVLPNSAQSLILGNNYTINNQLTDSLILGVNGFSTDHISGCLISQSGGSLNPNTDGISRAVIAGQLQWPNSIGVINAILSAGDLNILGAGSPGSFISAGANMIVQQINSSMLIGSNYAGNIVSQSLLATDGGITGSASSSVILGGGFNIIDTSSSFVSIQSSYTNASQSVVINNDPGDIMPATIERSVVIDPNNANQVNRSLFLGVNGNFNGTQVQDSVVIGEHTVDGGATTLLSILIGNTILNPGFYQLYRAQVGFFGAQPEFAGLYLSDVIGYDIVATNNISGSDIKGGILNINGPISQSSWKAADQTTVVGGMFQSIHANGGTGSPSTIQGLNQSIVLTGQCGDIGNIGNSLILSSSNAVMENVSDSVIVGNSNLSSSQTIFERSLIMGANHSSKDFNGSIVSSPGIPNSGLYQSTLCLLSGTTGGQPVSSTNSIIVNDAWNVNDIYGAVVVGHVYNDDNSAFGYSASLVVGNNIVFTGTNTVGDCIVVGAGSNIASAIAVSMILTNGSNLNQGVSSSVVVGSNLNQNGQYVGSLVLGDGTTFGSVTRSILLTTFGSYASIDHSIIIGSPVTGGDISNIISIGDTNFGAATSFGIYIGTLNSNPSGYSNVHLLGANLQAQGPHQTLLGDAYPIAAPEADATLGVGVNNGGTPTKIFSVHKDRRTEINGGQRLRSRVDAGATVTVDPSSDYIVIATGATDINLPPGVDGMTYTIINDSGGVPSFNANGGDLFSTGMGGLGTFNIVQNQTIQVHFIGGVWYPLAYF